MPSSVVEQTATGSVRPVSDTRTPGVCRRRGTCSAASALGGGVGDEIDVRTARRAMDVADGAEEQIAMEVGPDASFCSTVSGVLPQTILPRPTWCSVTFLPSQSPQSSPARRCTCRSHCG